MLLFSADATIWLLLRTVFLLILAALVGACTSAESGRILASWCAEKANEGKSLQNPIPATPESIASGKTFYDRLCADCHGEKGDGVSQMAAEPVRRRIEAVDLTDDQWEHGPTDGEIFVFIRDGAVGSGAMKGLNGRPGVGPTEMWNIVNYIRSIHRK